MDDSLRRLEKQLREAVPRGPGEFGRLRMEEQIDALVDGVEPLQGKGSGWRRLGGFVALVIGGAVLLFLTESEDPETASVAAGAVGAEGGMQVEEESRIVSEMVEDRGIVLTPSNEPMHAWGYRVEKVEMVTDPESGLRVRVVSRAEEEVLSRVTSF